MEQVNATQHFLGNETQWPSTSIELYDVQGLWGGRRIYVEGTKRVVVQVVGPTLLERRYEIGLEQDELRHLLDLFVENDFLTIHPQERTGIPDEARPRIMLVNGTGDKWEVAKWAGVRDERFDTLYRAVLRLEALTQNMEPVYHGPHEFGA